jgi:biopolymer transport protein ExbD
VKPLAQINVIPFIDVMLVLLAVVLTTATFVAQGKIPVDLPEARHSESLPPSPTVEIVIDLAGGIYFDGTPVTDDELAGQLGDLSPRDPILLRVDGGAEFARFVSVIDTLKARRLTNLSIVTRHGNE